jgi:hypothetical protein
MAQRSCRRERKLAAPQHVVSQAREAAVPELAALRVPASFGAQKEARLAPVIAVLISLMSVSEPTTISAPFALPAFASLICSMHKGGDGKAFVQELKSNGHASSSGGCQNKDSWFTHGIELLFDEWRDELFPTSSFDQSSHCCQSRFSTEKRAKFHQFHRKICTSGIESRSCATSGAPPSWGQCPFIGRSARSEVGRASCKERATPGFR